MRGLTATDRHGRTWELIAIESVICAFLVTDTRTPTVMSAPDLIDTHGPIRLSPDRCRLSPGSRDALVDVVDLVASEPETATVEQIREVAAAAHLLLGVKPAPRSA
ncbi:MULTISPECIES: hypothetical protein [Rhodococcus]|jgi:hypothetical protein|uniref:hypothetical protein n=1 Tax=Rhodococcus TaxID=1827 RepID=UPI0009D6BEF7|nr:MULTISPECIES: hypothetical protein [Rhodococcus]QQZ18903.1 hypothetical protein GO592_35955 [Rhodococcus sp. 21391]